MIESQVNGGLDSVVEEFLSKTGLLTETQMTPAAHEILTRITEFRRSGPALQRYLRSIADAVQAAGSPKQGDLLSGDRKALPGRGTAEDRVGP